MSTDVWTVALPKDGLVWKGVLKGVVQWKVGWVRKGVLKGVVQWKVGWESRDVWTEAAQPMDGWVRKGDWQKEHWVGSSTGSGWRKGEPHRYHGCRRLHHGDHPVGQKSRL